jgi:hypothetical protein
MAALLCMDRFRSSEWCTPGDEAGKLAGRGDPIKYHICTFLTYRSPPGRSIAAAPPAFNTTNFKTTN